MLFKPRRLTRSDIPRVCQFWVEHWGGDIMIVHGRTYRPEELDGFVVEKGEEWIGLITFLVKDEEVEVISLDSLREKQGIGTKLLETTILEARERNCRRIFLVTTNDNLNALGFYQKRGFELAAVHRGAVDESRRIKPSIPKIGLNGIPLRDEIEMEMRLSD